MANGLKENEALQVLDLSFCGLGRPKADPTLSNEKKPGTRENSAKKEPQKEKKEKPTNLTPEEQLK